MTKNSHVENPVVMSLLIPSLISLSFSVSLSLSVFLSFPFFLSSVTSKSTNVDLEI